MTCTVVTPIAQGIMEALKGCESEGLTVTLSLTNGQIVRGEILKLRGDGVDLVETLITGTIYDHTVDPRHIITVTTNRSSS